MATTLFLEPDKNLYFRHYTQLSGRLVQYAKTHPSQLGPGNTPDTLAGYLRIRAASQAKRLAQIEHLRWFSSWKIDRNSPSARRRAVKIAKEKRPTYGQVKRDCSGSDENATSISQLKKVMSVILDVADTSV